MPHIFTPGNPFAHLKKIKRPSCDIYGKLVYVASWYVHEHKYMCIKIKKHANCPRQQTGLAPRWPNVDPVGSPLGQRGPNVPCYLELFIVVLWNYEN